MFSSHKSNTQLDLMFLQPTTYKRIQVLLVQLFIHWPLLLYQTTIKLLLQDVILGGYIVGYSSSLYRLFKLAFQA